MRHNQAGFIIGFLSLAFSGMLLACVADKAHLQTENSLPPNELAYYNDSFDTMREDLWNKAGYINLEEQMQNFKLADMRIERQINHSHQNRQLQQRGPGCQVCA